MKMPFEKEMFFLNGVIDLWYVETFAEEETVWLELTALHMAKIYIIEGQQTPNSTTTPISFST